MTIRVAGSAEASEPGDFWYPADSSSSEDQLNAKVDGLFQSLTRGGAFEMKVGLGEFCPGRGKSERIWSHLPHACSRE